MITRLLAVLSIAGIAASCGSLPERDVAQRDVAAAVSDRSPLRVHWRSVGDDDAAIERELDALLARELSVDDAVAVALLENRDLQATYEELGIAQADLVQAGLLSNPLLGAEYRFAEGGGTAGIGLSIAQNFLSIFYVPLRRRIAAASFEAVESTVTGAVLAIAADVRSAYFDLQARQQTLELRQSVLAATEASHELARRLHEAGNIRDLDLSRERAQYEDARIDVAQAELDAIEARERLGELMGVWGNRSNWTIAARLAEAPTEPTAREDVESIAIERSLALQAARSEIDAQLARLGGAHREQTFPDAELGVSAEREAVEGTWSTGPSIALPLPLWNGGRAAFARAEASLRQLEQRYIADAVRTRARARSVAARVEALRQQAVFVRTTLLPLRQRVVEQTQLQYNGMQVGAFELLLAKRDEIETAAAWIETLREYWLARTELDLVLVGGEMREELRGERRTISSASNDRANGGHE